MSVREEFYCDICGRMTKPKDSTRMKVKSSRFVTYSNYDSWLPKNKTWDVCLDCLEEIKCRVIERQFVGAPEPPFKIATPVSDDGNGPPPEPSQQ